MDRYRVDYGDPIIINQAVGENSPKYKQFKKFKKQAKEIKQEIEELMEKFDINKERIAFLNVNLKVLIAACEKLLAEL